MARNIERTLTFCCFLPETWLPGRSCAPSDPPCAPSDEPRPPTSLPASTDPLGSQSPERNFLRGCGPSLPSPSPPTLLTWPAGIPPLSRSPWHRRAPHRVSRQDDRLLNCTPIPRPATAVITGLPIAAPLWTLQEKNPKRRKIDLSAPPSGFCRHLTAVGRRPQRHSGAQRVPAWLATA